MGEHSTRYQDFFHSFVKDSEEKNVDVVCLDFRGHGKSGGTRGHIESLNDLCDDVVKVINSQCEEGANHLIWGMGLGGIVALSIIHGHFSHLKEKVNGTILINPALKLKWQMPMAIEALVRADFLPLSRIKLPFVISGKDFAGNTLIAEEFDSDPLVNHSLSWASLLEIQQHASKIRTSAYYLDIPVFMGLSGNEQYYSNRVSELFSRGIAQCDLKIYPDSYHDIFHHFDCEKLAQDVYNWLGDNFFSEDS